MSNNPRITFLLPSKGRLGYLKATIRNLYFNIKAEIEIIVIYDPDDTDTASWITAQKNVIGFCERGSNIALSMNRACKYIHSEFISWWSDDLLVDKNCFDEMIEILESQTNEKVIGITAPYYDKVRLDIKNINNYPKEIKNKQGVLNSVGDFPKKGDSCPEFKYGIVRMDKYRELGMLDEDCFPGYGCDTDFCLKALYKGYQILPYKKIRIAHLSLKDETHIKLLKRTHKASRSKLRERWGNDFKLYPVSVPK